MPYWEQEGELKKEHQPANDTTLTMGCPLTTRAACPLRSPPTPTRKVKEHVPLERDAPARGRQNSQNTLSVENEFVKSDAGCALAVVVYMFKYVVYYT